MQYGKLPNEHPHGHIHTNQEHRVTLHIRRIKEEQVCNDKMIDLFIVLSAFFSSFKSKAKHYDTLTEIQIGRSMSSSSATGTTARSRYQLIIFQLPRHRPTSRPTSAQPLSHEGRHADEAVGQFNFINFLLGDDGIVIHFKVDIYSCVAQQVIDSYITSHLSIAVFQVDTVMVLTTVRKGYTSLNSNNRGSTKVLIVAYSTRSVQREWCQAKQLQLGSLFFKLKDLPNPEYEHICLHKPWHC